MFHPQQKRMIGKFQSKTIEGIFVGYGSNSHAYRVYNKSNGCVLETCDVVFDEFNGSHGEQVDLSDAGGEDSSQDILTMGVGALLPMEQEPHDDEEEDGSFTHHQTTSTPIPSQVPIAQPMPLAQVEEDAQVSLHDNLQEQDHHQGQEQASPIVDDEPQQMQYEQEDLPPHINDPYVEDVDDGHEVEPRETLTSIMPRVAGRVDVDKILTDISEVLNHSRYKRH